MNTDTLQSFTRFIIKKFRMCCLAHEHMAELKPIIDEIRARGEVGNAYPLHVGSTAGLTLHTAHSNPNTCHWVINTVQ